MERPRIWMLLSFLVIMCMVNIGCKGKTYAGLSLQDVFSDQSVGQLADAAANGNTDKINSLIAGGVNVNAIGKYGITPLWWALIVYAESANSQSYDGFVDLLKKGADPNMQIEGGGYDNVMYLAAMVKDSRFLQAAINAGGNVNLISRIPKGQPPIFAAILARNQSNIDLLVAHGADLNTHGFFGETPMMTAADINDYANVYNFLTKGADPTLKRDSGQTIVWNIEHSRVEPQYPAYQWRQKVIDLLKQKGITINEATTP